MRVTLSSNAFRRWYTVPSRLQRGAIGLDLRARVGAEALQVVEQGLDLVSEERDDRHLGPRIEAHLDLGDALVGAVGQLVESGQGPRVVGHAQNIPGEGELGEQVRLDREGALRRRAANVRQAVEWVDVTEDDRLHLEGRPGPGPLALDAVEHRFAESPLHRGVDRRALLLDERLDPAVQLLLAPLHRHREERHHLLELREVRGVQVAGLRRGEVQHTDQLLLIVEGRHDHVTGADAQDFLLDVGPARVRGEVLDDERLALLDRPRVDRALELRHRMMRGVGEDAGVLEAVAGVEHQHLVAIDGGEPEAQLRPPEQRAQLLLQALEARGRDDRLFVDQVPLERREHLLVGHLHRPQHGEAAEHEAVRREQRHQGLKVGEMGGQALPIEVGRHRAHRHRVHEA